MAQAVLALVIATAALTGSDSRAWAHNFDNNSLWVCAATRPTENFSIDHSQPIFMGDGWVIENCFAHQVWYGHQACWQAQWNVNNGNMGILQGYYYNGCPWSPH